MTDMRSALFILLICGYASVHADPVRLQNIRIWAAPDNTRIVFDIDSPVEQRMELLTSPDRLVIDLQNTRIDHAPAQPAAKDNFVQEIRSAMRNQDDLRIVLDLKQSVRINSFLLQPNRQYGHRLVVDLTSTATDLPPQTESVKTTSTDLRDVVIAIDAGHGGDDPGAKGPGGVFEKEVVLQISKRLAELINQEKGMKAVLTRQGDYFIPLRKRMELARNQKADLFISIHADAFRDPGVSGSSVYILSERGASSEAARWLAERENASDLIGGVSLDTQDNVLASVLLDLSQTASLEASIDVADRVLSGLKQLGKVHKRSVQSAGFAVLKSPDVPSILVETAYISNPSEEKKLRSSEYQTKLAGALLNGLRGYFTDHALEGTYLASIHKPIRRHTITRGDTLSKIAEQYQVSTKDLRERNGLKSDVIKVGQILDIPTDS